MKLKANIADVHRGLRKPTEAKYRDMVAGETRAFLYTGPESARFASSLQCKVGGNFTTTKQLLIDPVTGTATWVLLVLCIKPATPKPAPKPRGRKPRAETLAELRRRIEALEQQKQES